jgi:hypothetical protein
MRFRIVRTYESYRFTNFQSAEAVEVPTPTVQFGVLCELRGCSLRPLRLKAFDFSR